MCAAYSQNSILPNMLCGTLQVQRLPFLHSSNLSLEILNGNYDCIGFEDILNGKNLFSEFGDMSDIKEGRL